MTANLIVWNLPTDVTVDTKRIESENNMKKKSLDVLVKEEDTPKYELMVVEQPVIEWKVPEPMKPSEYYAIELTREPMTTFCITPNNAPANLIDSRFDKRERGMLDDQPLFNSNRSRNKDRGMHEGKSASSDMILNSIHGIYQNFYLPHRIRFVKNGLKVKMNDVISYKIAIDNQTMKFYFSVPSRWSRNFISAIKHEWGETDILEVPNKIMDFDVNKSKVMEVDLKLHYALSLKHAKDDTFMQSVSSLATTLDKEEKVLIDFNVEPVNNTWKENAVKTLEKYKRGKPATKEHDFTKRGILLKITDTLMSVVEEAQKLLENLIVPDEPKSKTESKKPNLPYPNHNDQEKSKTQFSENKIFPTVKGYKLQTRVICQSDNQVKLTHTMKSLKNCFNLVDGDNRLIFSEVKQTKAKQKLINAVENNKPTPLKSPNILSETELKNFITLPSKQTLQEYKNVIAQENFTRTEIDDAFFDDSNYAIPFAKTLDKEPKTLHMPAYEREDWTEKGRKTKDKQALDDVSVSTMVFGGMSGGKTSLTENRILYQFGAHLKDKEEWKKVSKSVIAIDVADGAMVKNIYERLEPWQRERVVILNHSNFKNPIAVNNADLSEFNTEVMKDDDYSYTLAEMESRLVLEILKSEKTISMDRWFTSALQIVHLLDKDWGYIEAMRTLIDTDFRDDLLHKLKPLNRRLHLELNSYHQMASQGKVNNIIETIQNRFSQLERDQKLWDCIAQKPLRDEEGKVKLNFRKLMDGDKDGAYLVLIYIPKTGVSQLYRKFVFAHYFTKIWNVALSREVGFAGREYRPEVLIAIDEIHQIIDIPIVAKLFIDIFKEPRKYSVAYWFTLHGWSSLAKAGRGLEGDIKQSIMDNGANFIMLRGGQEAFQSLSNFLQPMTIADYNNLMNMDYCGIFAIKRNNKNHVIQARLPFPIDHKRSIFKKHQDLDLEFLANYKSPYGLDRDLVREDNLNRSSEMIEESLKNSLLNVGEGDWEELEKAGMKD